MNFEKGDWLLKHTWEKVLYVVGIILVIWCGIYAIAGDIFVFIAINGS